jgi:hypothetical protein
MCPEFRIVQLTDTRRYYSLDLPRRVSAVRLKQAFIRVK